MLSKPLNNGEFYETHLAYWLALIYSLHCSSNRQSELKVTNENAPNAPPCFKYVIFQHHYLMQKNNHCIETEQSYLCRVLCFTRKKKMLISLPED